MPAERRSIDLASGLSAALPPVWFDAQSAAAVKASAIQAASAIGRPRPPGIYAYCASLALAAGDKALAQRMTQAGANGPWGVELQAILESQRRVAGGLPDAAAPLTGVPDRCPPTLRPTALYWLGRGHLADGNRQHGKLALLRLAAGYGGRQPELSGAALHYAAESLDGDGAAERASRLRQELRVAYPGTHFAVPQQTTAQATVHSAVVPPSDP